MKKQFIILFFAASMLFGCGGNDSKKNVNSNDEPSSQTTELTDTESNEPERIPHVAIETVKKLAEMDLNPLYLNKETVENLEFVETDGNEEHCWFAMSDEEDEEETFVSSDCFPLTDGGYAVIITKTSGCCLCHYNDYYTYYFKNGSLTKATGLLPETTIDDFYANANDFPQKAYDILSTCADYYKFDTERNRLICVLDPYECEESIRVYLPKAIRGLYLKIDEGFEDFTENEQREAIGEGDYTIFPEIVFHWEGNTFVRDENNKPLVEALKYFDKFDEFAKSASSVDKLYRGDDCMDLEEDLNGDGFPDFVNNDYEWQEIVIYLNDGNGAYHRFGEYECLEGFYISEYDVTDGVLEIFIYDDTDEYSYQFLYQDGDFCLLDHPEIKLGSFKFGEDLRR